MRETIIENRWVKMTGCERTICTVYFHYSSLGAKPFVTFGGYNPFPFFCEKERLYTSKTVFNAWMEENGWRQILKTSDVFSCTTIVKQD